MKDTNVHVERKCEYCGCPESTAVNAVVKCNMMPGKPLHSFQEKSVPVEKEAKMKFAAFCPKKDCNGDCNYSGGHSLVVEVAQRIVDLTGYGQALHVNDILPDLKELFSQAIQAAKEEERTSHRVRVGMLRQWLNEDRITDTSKMVTNEDIEYWLSIINKHQ